MVECLSDSIEYICRENLDLYDSSECKTLATQARKGRYLRWLPEPQNQINRSTSILVQLCEDDYTAWLPTGDQNHLEMATQPYHAPVFSDAEIQAAIPQVIEFTQAAMETPNYYLWGGTVSPNYDCSGLMQAAFASAGIWIPRDAYQQEAFTQPITFHRDPLDFSSLLSGDLIFFGTPQKATHVGLYLTEGQYIHSSGREHGRNGIKIDVLSPEGDACIQYYFQQLRGVGRVISSYQPTASTHSLGL
ncbi:NLP/P60 [Planktothrix tepida PCC 9214]|uniref:NLP/P60 n=2 Tax=Planktothrix TaxID=54304 RepID=A0A1J1LQK6_9CYAN|nr:MULTISPECIES: C40 family peptidase [Planktothrix]CAD5939021.1 putative endopeptidase p60 [Planktothrix pseudagardhii]CUR34526.1 NLP/P60 [Planktothrix tepida PCC 9214]